MLIISVLSLSNSIQQTFFQNLIIVSGVDLKIAQVSGDNLYPIREKLFTDDQIREMNTGQSLPKTVHSMTAYYGAGFHSSFFLLSASKLNAKSLILICLSASMKLTLPINICFSTFKLNPSISISLSSLC